MAALERSQNQSKLSAQAKAQHARGKLTAHERLEILFDEGSFIELGSTSDASVITGYGTIHGRRVHVFAKDYTCLSGSLSPAHAEKISEVQARAIVEKTPLISLYDSGGLRFEDGLTALSGYGNVIAQYVQASGVIPQISLLMGPCIGSDAFAAGLADFLFMVSDTSSLFVTGPRITNELSGSDLTPEELGGASLHAERSGIAAARYEDDTTALSQLRRFVDFLPSSHAEHAHAWPSFDESDRVGASLDTLVPDDSAASYDVKEAILKIVDECDLFETQGAFAQNVVTGFARLQGRTIGVLGNQPLNLGGAIDCAAAGKAARFVSFCNHFQVPIITFVDVPGFLPGLDQEEAGLARHGAELMHAYAQATVPKITVILGQAYGAAAIMMGSKQLGAEKVFAWPSAQIGLTNDSGSDLSAAEAQGMIDAVIQPSMTRKHLIEALAGVEAS